MGFTLIQELTLAKCLKHHSKIQPGKERVYFILQPSVHHEGQELKSGTEGAKTVEESCILAGTSCLLIPHRTISLVVMLPTVGGGLPHQALIKKMPLDRSTGQSDGGRSSAESPFLDVCL